MSVSSIASPLVTLDVISDYIPVVSTLTNLVVLFQKCLVVPFMKADFIETSHYFTHLKNKTFTRCLVLTIPVLGNAIVLLYDLAFLKVHRDIRDSKKEVAPLEVSQPI